MAEQIELTKERSEEQAQEILQISLLLQNLDIAYLREWVKQARDHHSLRQAASVIGGPEAVYKVQSEGYAILAAEAILKAAEAVHANHQALANHREEAAKRREIARMFGL